MPARSIHNKVKEERQKKEVEPRLAVPWAEGLIDTALECLAVLTKRPTNFFQQAEQQHRRLQATLPFRLGGMAIGSALTAHAAFVGRWADVIKLGIHNHPHLLPLMAGVDLTKSETTLTCRPAQIILASVEATRSEGLPFVLRDRIEAARQAGTPYPLESLGRPPDLTPEEREKAPQRDRERITQRLLSKDINGGLAIRLDEIAKTGVVTAELAHPVLFRSAQVAARAPHAGLGTSSN